jgi:hypothetical protein
MTAETMLKALLPEVRQSERSAIRHPEAEARRLGPCPPAEALMAVAEHAKREEPSLDAMAEARASTRNRVGAALGSLFSIGRNRMADHLLTAEQSYRGTLLGLWHGVHAVTQFRSAAVREGDPEVVAWCDRWLAEREPLVRGVVEQMQWFVDHPDRGLRAARFIA